MVHLQLWELSAFRLCIPDKTVVPGSCHKETKESRWSWFTADYLDSATSDHEKNEITKIIYSVYIPFHYFTMWDYNAVRYSVISPIQSRTPVRESRVYIEMDLRGNGRKGRTEVIQKWKDVSNVCSSSIFENIFSKVLQTSLWKIHSKTLCCFDSVNKIWPKIHM